METLYLVTAMESWEDWKMQGTDIKVEMVGAHNSVGYMMIFRSLEDAEKYVATKNKPDQYEVIPVRVAE